MMITVQVYRLSIQLSTSSSVSIDTNHQNDIKRHILFCKQFKLHMKKYTVVESSVLEKF